MTTLYVAAGCHVGASVSVDIGGPVILRGPMGCGKSTIGHALSLALYGVTMDGRPWPWGDGEIAIEGTTYSYAIRASGGRVERSMALGEVMTRVSGERIHSALGALGVSADGVPTPVGMLILSPSLWLRWLADADGQRRMRRTLEVALPGPTAADVLGPELASLTLREAESRATSARRAEDTAHAAHEAAGRALRDVGDVDDVEPVDATAELAAHDAALRAWSDAADAWTRWGREMASLDARRRQRDAARDRLGSVPCGGWTLWHVESAMPLLGEPRRDVPVDCSACPLLRDASEAARDDVPANPLEPPDPGPRPEPPDIVDRAAAYAVALDRRRQRDAAVARLTAAERAVVLARPVARQAERDLERVRSAPGEALAAKLDALRAHLTDGVDVEASGDAVRVTWHGRDARDCSTGEQVRVGVVLRHALRMAIGRPDAAMVVDNAQDMGPVWPEELTRDVLALYTGGSRLEVVRG